MKKALLAIALLSYTLPALSQTRADYDTAVNRFVRFFNARTYDSVYNMFSPRIQSLTDVVKTRKMLNDLNFSLDEIHEIEYLKSIDRISYYKAKFHEATLTLLISLNADKKIETFRFVPYQTDASPTNFVLKTPSGGLYGTLTLPRGTQKVPVVLIIAGSGATDRDGNQGGMTPKTYKMLADSLQKQGIASLRYDKRGVGESAAVVKGEETLRFEDYIDDAARFIDSLRKDKRFSKVIVLGHSEGSLIGMVAAQKTKASAFISVAGAAQRVDKVIKKQLFEKSDELARKASLAFDTLEQGGTLTNVDPDLAFLFRPSVQPYMRSWLQYEPQEEIKKLKIPVLILQGGNDVQVGTAHAELLKSAHPSATMMIIDSMSHVMKPGPRTKQENIATYNDPNLSLSPELTPAIVDFIKKVKR